MITVNLDEIIAEFRVECKRFNFDQNALIFSNLETMFNAEYTFSECLDDYNIVHIDYHYDFSFPKNGEIEFHANNSASVRLSSELGTNGKNATILHELSHAIIHYDDMIIAKDLIEGVCCIIPYIIGKVLEIPELSNFSLLRFFKNNRNVNRMFDNFTYGFSHIETIVNIIIQSIIE